MAGCTDFMNDRVLTGVRFGKRAGDRSGAFTSAGHVRRAIVGTQCHRRCRNTLEWPVACEETVVGVRPSERLAQRSRDCGARRAPPRG